MALFVELTFDSAAGLRAEWEARLKAGKLSAPGRFTEEPPPFADVLVVLIVAGSEVVRVPAVVIDVTESATEIEVVPESRAFLGAKVTALVDGGATGGEGKKARLFDDARPIAPASSDDAFEEAPTGKHRSQAEAQSVDKKIAALSVGEKVRLAMHGSREERVWLAKDRAGAVQASLVRNPRITIDEILALARAPHLSPDAAEAMTQHPTYGTSAQIALALVRNPRTPIPIAVELVGKLQPHDLRVIAKGLNVRAPIAQAARKRLHNGD